MLSGGPPTVPSTVSSPSSISSHITKPHIDAFIEASLTSVKNAIYHAIGHCTGHGIGYHNATVTSYLRSVTAGFIGGAIFTIPYLFQLGWNGSSNSPDAVIDPDRSLGLVLRDFGIEVLYTAIAGGVGSMVIGCGRVDGILVGVVDGLCGPMIFYSSLYLMLKGAVLVVAHL